MSTKTTLKRIALVAVSALGFGLVSTVTPANAAEPTTWSIGTATANVAVVGQTSRITVPVTITTNAAASDTLTVAVLPVAWPAGSAVDAAADVARLAGTAIAASSPYTGVATWSAAGAYNYSTLTFTTAGAADYASSTSVPFTFTPDIAGSYTFAYFKDTDVDGALDSNESVKYLTIAATSAPAAKVVLTQQLAGTGSTSAGGLYVRVNAADSAGALTRLASSQLLMITVPSGLTLAAKSDGTTETALTGVTATDYGLAAADFNSNGYAWLKFTSTTAGTKAVTAKISNGTDVTSLGLVYAATAGTATVCGTVGTAGNPNGSDVPASSYALMTSGNTSTTSLGYVASTATTSTVTVCSATDDAVIPVAIEDTDLSIFGSAAALTQTIAITVGDDADTAGALDGSAGKAVGSFDVTHGALGNKTNTTTKKTFTVTAGSVGAFVVQGQTSATGASGTTTITPATSVKVVNGGSITFTAAVTDQFGTAKSGLAITAQVTAGRNLQATATNLVSDANGKVTFTVTDAAPTSTTTTSTVTFGGGASGSATITWVSALAATTMTTSPSAVSNDTADKAFDAGAVSVSGTASAGADSVTATAKDENGVAIAGLPVTITLPADVTLKSTSTATAYTNSSGVASWSIYTTKAGTYALTFAGGGLTKTSYIKWTGGSQRNITAVAGTTTGDVTPVTITVKDAHGNAVPSLAGVSLTATGGYFQGIPMTSSQTTDANGQIIVAFVGSGTVTAKITGGQTLDLAGYVGTTAATGFPAGNQTASATITGGANASAAAAEAASDAAAEAIDAANAATDAANLAAEAADAATVAAEEARDAADAATAAVEELATQVATLMAALKAQITTLANTVAKIAKKVKA